MRDRKQVVIAEMSDVVTRFLHYDRKDDDEPPPEAIEEALQTGDATVDNLIQVMRRALEARI